jgi:anti-anti-sigma factor
VTELAHVEAEQRGQACLVRMTGEVDMSNAKEVSAAIEGAMPNSARILVLDLAGTSYLDSGGVGLLFRLAERLRSRRQELRLLVPAGAPVRTVLELTGAAKVIRLDALLDEALADADAGTPDEA